MPNIEQPTGPTNLLRPFLLISYSAYYIIPTIIDLIIHFKIGTLFSFSAFKDAWFARFWTWFGPRSVEYAGKAVVPLLNHNASGVCVDIGPGNGQWLKQFAKANNASITKIYGVEPNHDMHRELRQSAINAGLGDIYEIIGCGAEELTTKGGIQPGSIDTIITVQCLCSIPTPEKVIKELYPILKPGGKWLMFEHIKTKYQDHFVAYWQVAVNLIWPHFFNGCDITRPTDEWVLQSGDWEKVDLKTGASEGPYDTVPHIIGTLTKKK